MVDFGLLAELEPLRLKGVPARAPIPGYASYSPYPSIVVPQSAAAAAAAAAPAAAAAAAVLFRSPFWLKPPRPVM